MLGLPPMILTGRLTNLQRMLPGLAILNCGAAGIAWLDHFIDIAPADLESTLNPEEFAYAASIQSAARRHEYLKARFLAHHLLKDSSPLRKAPSGMPLWPQGFVGSITHKDGAVGVACSTMETTLALGIDAEDVGRMQLAFEQRILSESESKQVDRLVAHTGAKREHWLTLLFSAKEALFKCHYPLGGIMFYFHDAELAQIDSGKQSIDLRLKRATSALTPAGHITHGSWLERTSGRRSLLITSMSEPAAAHKP